MKKIAILAAAASLAMAPTFASADTVKSDPFAVVSTQNIPPVNPVIIGLGVVGVIGIVAVAASGGSSSSTTTTP